MKVIRLDEQQYKYCVNNLFEDVYISDIDSSNKTATLTYNQRSSGSRSYNRGNKLPGDVVKTDKMDNLSGSDTYDVSIKGGLKTFNITDINGTYVMSYFKSAFKQEQKKKLKFGNEEYSLEMDNPEFANFMKNFTQKVNAVVEYRTKEFTQGNKDVQFTGVSIYPVKSSSGFNTEMAKRLEGRHNIAGLPVTTLNTALLEKNTENLAIDDDFVKRNEEYYNSPRYVERNAFGDMARETHLQALTTDMNKLRSFAAVKRCVEKLNSFVRNKNGSEGPLLFGYYQLNSYLKRGDENTIKVILRSIGDLYGQYQRACDEMERAARFKNVYKDRMVQRPRTGEYAYATPIKFTKDPSVINRTKTIVELLNQYGLNRNLVSNSPEVCCNKYPIQVWQAPDFQIKKFKNDTRLALKNYFQPNKDEQFVKQEMEKTQGTVVVVFDDNISGGATLSDICAQLQGLGVEYLIPITFGKMRESWTDRSGFHIVNQPDNGFNLESLQRNNIYNI